MHWAAEAGHLSTLKILCDHFAVWTDSDKVRLSSYSFPNHAWLVRALLSLALTHGLLQFGRNALHCAALGGHRDCAFLLIRKAREPMQFHSLTMVRIEIVCLFSRFLTHGVRILSTAGVARTQTNKTPSRCAFEAGHSTLASRLQAWEEGTGEYSTNEDDYIPSSDHSSFRSTMDEEEIQLVINPSPTRSTLLTVACRHCRRRRLVVRRGSCRDDLKVLS